MLDVGSGLAFAAGRRAAFDGVAAANRARRLRLDILTSPILAAANLYADNVDVNAASNAFNNALYDYSAALYYYCWVICRYSARNIARTI